MDFKPAVQLKIPQADVNFTSQLQSVKRYHVSSLTGPCGSSGTSIYAGFETGEVAVWRNVRFDLKRPASYDWMGSHNAGISHLIYHKSWSLLLSISLDGELRLWASRKLVSVVKAHERAITAAAAHCNTLLTASSDHTCKLWKLEEGEAVMKQIFAFDAWVTSIFAINNGDLTDALTNVLVGDAEGGLTILKSHASPSADIMRMEVVKHVKNFHNLGISKIVCARDQGRVLSLSWEDHLQFSDIHTLRHLSVIKAPSSGTRFVDFLWNNVQEEIVLLEDNGNLSIWKWPELRCISQIRSVRSKPFGVRFTFGLPEQYVLVYAINEIWCQQVHRQAPYNEHTGHTGRVLATHFMNVQHAKDVVLDEKTKMHDKITHDIMVSASNDNTIRFWATSMESDYSPESTSLIQMLTETDQEISAFLYVRFMNESLLITGHERGLVKSWNALTYRSWSMDCHSNTISCIVEGSFRVGPSMHHHIATGSFDGCLATFTFGNDTFAPVRQKKWKVSDMEILCLVHDPDRYAYICAGNEGFITSWDIGTCKRLALMTPPAVDRAKSKKKQQNRTSHAQDQSTELPPVTCLAVHGDLLFASREDGAIFLLSLTQYSTLKTFKGHNAEVTSLVLIKETGLLASASVDGCSYLWLQNGRCVGAFKADRSFTSLAYQYHKAANRYQMMYGTESGSILTCNMKVDDAQDLGHDNSSKSRPRTGQGQIHLRALLPFDKTNGDLEDEDSIPEECLTARSETSTVGTMSQTPIQNPGSYLQGLPADQLLSALAADIPIEEEIEASDV